MTPLNDDPVVIPQRARFYVSPQMLPGNLAPPIGAPPTLTTGGPVRIDKGGGLDFAPTQKWESHNFASESARDFVGSTYQGIVEIPWSAKCPIVPPADLLGTIMPEAHHLLVSVLGVVNVNAGAAIGYSTGTLSRINPLTLSRLHNANQRLHGEWLVDALPATMKLSWSGGERPMLEFTGEAARYVQAVRTIVPGTLNNTGQATIQHAHSVNEGARITIGTNNNDGAGYIVTSVSDDGLTVFFTPTMVTTGSANASLEPFMPPPTYSTQPPLGIVGRILVAGQRLPATSFEVEVNNNVSFEKGDAGSENMTDGVPTEQTIIGKLTLRASEAVLRARSAMLNGAMLMIHMGSNQGRMVTVAMPRIQADLDKLETNSKLGTTAFPFKALDTAENAGDALSITFS